MTRKDYKLIAGTIKWAAGFPEADPTTILIVRQALTDALAADNPRFDRGRFNDACAGKEAR